MRLRHLEKNGKGVTIPKEEIRVSAPLLLMANSTFLFNFDALNYSFKPD
jgi:hypothetical protein